MSRAYELAEKWYPNFWLIDRLVILVENKKLTEEEYQRLTGYTYPATSHEQTETEKGNV